MKRSSWTRLALPALLWFALASLPLAATAQHQLVVGAPKNAFAAPDPSPRILRARAVALDLPSAAKASARAKATLEIAFFDDAVYSVLLERQEATHSGGVAYSGEVAGLPHSTVVIVDNAGTVSVRVHVPGRRFSIRGSAETGYVAREHVDADKPAHDPKYEREPPLGVREIPRHLLKSLPVEVPPPETAADNGASIDVMVVYTQAARAANGGTAQVHAEIDADITLTNGFYANSNVVQRLRLVYRGEVTYTEVNMDVDLPRLASVNDGFLDEVPVLRDLYRADFVSLWGVYTDYCGFGYLMATESNAFAGSAYNIVDSPGCTGPGTHTFAHELGHNMGLRHENYVDTTPTTNVTPEAGGPAVNITYAHGYVDTVNRFRTVMAYGNQCAALAINCAFIPHFSNPAITFDNRAFYGAAAAAAPTGNAAGGNERQALNDTRDTTANFRQPQLASFTGPGSILFIPTTASVAEGAGSIALKVARHLGSTGAVSVGYATTAGTAAAGSDYTTTSGTLNWANGDTADKTINVPILQDSTLEGHETFTVTLSAPTGGASIVAGGGTATVRIVDDEPDTFPVGSTLPAGYTSPNVPNANTPNSQWTVDTTQGHLSTASLRSAQARAPDGTFANFGNSDLEYSATLNAGTLSFHYKLSSYHSGLAAFEFQVDGVTVFSNNAGGEVDWTLVSVPVTAGAHTLRWRFKNKLPFPCALADPAPPGGGACADRAWIDAVTFPTVPFTLTVVRSGNGVGTVTGAGINCNPDCIETVNSGTVIALSATPALGSTFTGWSGAGCSGTGGCSVTVNADKTVTASFTLVRYTVNTSAGPNGSISPAWVEVDHGSTTAFLLEPDAGYVASIGGNCPAGSIFRDTYTTGRIRADCTVTATFAPAPVTLTVSKAGTGSGSVSGPGIDCGVDCAEAVSPGTSIALTATASAGSTFAGWSGGGCSGTAGCTVTVNADATVTATFTINQYTVTPSEGANGSISPNTAQTVAHGATRAFTVTPSSGYTAAVGGTCGGSLAGTTYTTNAITANCTVAATFTQVTYTVTSSAGANGSISPLGAQTVGHGATATFTVTPDAAYGAAVGGTCGGVLVGTTFTTNAVTANCTVVAAFPLVNPPRLVNISTRMQVLTGDNVMIGGLIVGGSVNKTVVIRARGPSMVPAGVTNPLVNPKLDLYSGQTVIASSDDWGGNVDAPAITASGFAPPEAAEAAILINLAPGPYTAIVSGVGGTTGVGLVEVFEVDHPEVPLINIATRGRVQTGLDVMIAGFIIQGAGQQAVVVRARGPSLTAHGVPNVLANPTLALVRSSDGVVIAANDDWQTAANAADLTASGFAPSDPLEAAILITLDPGAYTAIVRGAGETSGVAIVEVFRN